MARFARWLVRYPIVFVAANLLVTAVLGVFALRIRIEGSLESVLPAGDPEVEYYTRVRATFGSDDVGVVGVRADDIFAPATIGKIARVTDALGRISGVERVLSIANAVDPAEDVFKPPRLLPNIPPSSVEVQELKQKLRSTPLYGKNLVADDFKGAAINVFFRNLTDAEYLDLGIDDQIRDVLAGESGPERFFYTGAAHVKQAAVELMRRDLFRFTPIALLVILAVLWLSFWTVRGDPRPRALRRGGRRVRHLHLARLSPRGARAPRHRAADRPLREDLAAAVPGAHAARPARVRLARQDPRGRRGPLRRRLARGARDPRRLRLPLLLRREVGGPDGHRDDQPRDRRQQPLPHRHRGAEPGRPQAVAGPQGDQ